jgi:hypothetical protein
MNLSYFIPSILGITSAVIWLGKLIITKSFDARTEEYKAELTKDIEEFKNELSKVSMEHQVRFSKLHEQRAEIVKYFFGEIVELEGLLIHATSINQGPEFMLDIQRDDTAMDKIRGLINYFDLNRIFFSKSTVVKVDAIFKESWEIIAQMRAVRRSASEANRYTKQNTPLPQSYVSASDLWDKAFERSHYQYKALKEELANEFRMLLGISVG